MNQTKIYLGKLYSQILYYVKTKLNLSYSNIQEIKDDEYLEIIPTIKNYLHELERSDTETIKSSFPKILIDEEDYVFKLDEAKKIIQELVNYSSMYQTYITNYQKDLAKALDEEYLKRGFIGSFPKYYRIENDELLFAEYDEDIYMSDELTKAKRINILIKIPNFEQNFPSFNFETFSYLDLFTLYQEKLQSGMVRSFIVYLPDRDYLVELSKEDINDDVRYLDVLDAVLSKQKYLPRWYQNIQKSEKDIRRMLFISTILLVLFVISILNYLLFNGSIFPHLLVFWLAGGVADYYVCKALAKRLYQKYHTRN